MAGLDDLTHWLEEMDFLVFPLGDSSETRVSGMEMED